MQICLVELRGPEGKDKEIEEERGAFLEFATLLFQFKVRCLKH